MLASELEGNRLPEHFTQQSATPGLDSQPPSFYVEERESLSVLKSCYFRFLLLTVKSSSN